MGKNDLEDKTVNIQLAKLLPFLEGRFVGMTCTNLWSTFGSNLCDPRKAFVNGTRASRVHHEIGRLDTSLITGIPKIEGPHHGHSKLPQVSSP